VSQHIGDLDHPLSLAAQERTVTDYERLYGLEPVAVACDLHPDYATTRLAEASGLPVITVQHHHAHVASAMAEHDLTGEVLGVSWDGTGYGTDGTVWGGGVPPFVAHRVSAHGAAASLPAPRRRGCRTPAVAVGAGSAR
jgi:hydrogenase maturation protein HypF